jgi:hypothetical protein
MTVPITAPAVPPLLLSSPSSSPEPVGELSQVCAPLPMFRVRNSSRTDSLVSALISDQDSAHCNDVSSTRL